MRHLHVVEEADPQTEHDLVHPDQAVLFGPTPQQPVRISALSAGRGPRPEAPAVDLVMPGQETLSAYDRSRDVFSSLSSAERSRVGFYVATHRGSLVYPTSLLD